MKPVIPDSALADCAAIIGRVGAGKSYTARGLVERVLDRGERLCVIDPTGVWWGLRLGSDGKKAGYPVVVFGGDYADVKIGEHSGPALAELIAGRNLPCVLDVSEFTIGARTRFLTQFLETLYIKNPKTPLTLVVDEADMVAPQRIQPDQTVMFSRLEQIVRRGRVRGFRPWLITQRPAELHKSVLSQAATLIALKLTSPQDRKAAEEWVMGHGDKEQGKEVLASLAGLNRGEGWAWCPGSDILERVQFPKIKTYDSMRTPQVGSSHPAPAKLSDVDLSAIQDGLKAVEAEVAANDPRKLKARIAELERAAKVPAPIVDQRAIDAARIEGFNAGMLEGWAQAKSAALNSLSILGEPSQRQVPARAVVRPIAILERKPAPAEPQDAPPSVRKIIDTIHGSYPVALTFAAAAARAGISRRSSAYGAYEKAVRASPEIEADGGRLKSAPGYASPVHVNGGDPVETWAQRLPPSYGAMLRVIAQAGPMDKDEVAARANVSPTSSGLIAGLKELCALALVNNQDGRYQLADGLA